MQEIGLKDCELYVHPWRDISGSGIGLNLHLPSRIDLNAIDPYQTHAGGHYLWTNSFGTLYVPCTYKVGFWPGEEYKHVDPSENGFSFESVRPWFDSKWHGYRFTLRGRDRDLQPVVGADKSDVLAVISESETLDAFLKSFLGWVNAFAQEYGEEHFYKVEF